MKKILYVILFLIFLSFSLVYFSETGLVKASEAIVIKEDGSVSPTTAPIQRNGNTYTLNDNIYSSIILQRNNALFNGGGHYLQGNGTGTGLLLNHVTRVTVQHLKVFNFEYGIFLNWSTECTVENCEASNNQIDGIKVWEKGNNLLKDNIAIGNLDDGIQITYGESNFVISNNSSENGDVGIGIISSSFNVISGNNVLNNNRGFDLSDDNIVYSQNNTIFGNNITRNNIGIFIYHSPRTLIYSNNFFENKKQVSTYMDHDPQWDNGKRGNYWSDYDGTNGNSDGVWDTPYVINRNNQDNYPLFQVETLDEVEIPNFPVHTGALSLSSNEIAIVAAITVTVVIGIAVYWIIIKRK